MMLVTRSPNAQGNFRRPTTEGYVDHIPSAGIQGPLSISSPPGEMGDGRDAGHTFARSIRQLAETYYGRGRWIVPNCRQNIFGDPICEGLGLRQLAAEDEAVQPKLIDVQFMKLLIHKGGLIL